MLDTLDRAQHHGRIRCPKLDFGARGIHMASCLRRTNGKAGSDGEVPQEDVAVHGRQEHACSAWARALRSSHHRRS